jgi:outer membrane protein TolC
LAEKAFAGGAMPFIEYLDARTQITQAELGLNVAKYRLLQAYAAQERESATYSLN